MKSEQKEKNAELQLPRVSVITVFKLFPIPPDEEVKGEREVPNALNWVIMN